MSRHQEGPGFVLGRFAPPCKPVSRSRRLQQRYRRACRVSDIANDVSAGLAWLHRQHSSPDAANNSIDISVSSLLQPATTVSPSVQQRLRGGVWDMCSEFDRRTASLFASGDQVSDYIPKEAPPVLHGSYVGASSPPKFVVADRISLPSASESVLFTDLLPPAERALYTSPAGGLLKDNVPESLPPCAFLCEDKEYLKLLRRMDALDMIAWLEPDQVKAYMGMFAVDKADPSEDRLIGDARRTNALHITPQKVELPSPEAFASLEVPAKQRCYVAKCDLAVFFYGLRLPLWLVCYFCWPPVSRAAVGLPGEGIIVPAFTRVPMGWSHAPRVAQLVHEYVLSRGNFLPRDNLSGNNSFRLQPGRVAWFVYIDDCVLVGLSRQDVERQLQHLMTLYDRFHLRVKLSKVVHATCDPVEVLGLEFDGVRLQFGLAPAKLAKLLLFTDHLLAEGQCTGKQMEQLVGRYVWAAMARRPLLACFQAVYRFMRCAGNKTYRLWPSVRAELRAIVNLAPMFLCRLPQVQFSKVVATDASSSGMAVVSLGAAKVPALNAIMARRWSTIVSHRWRFPVSHINVGELSAVSTGVRWVLTSPSSVNSRLLMVCDSQVVCAVLSKGRTSSFGLLRPLRALWAWVLAANLHLRLQWVPSHLMPADEPSRF